MVEPVQPPWDGAALAALIEHVRPRRDMYMDRSHIAAEAWLGGIHEVTRLLPGAAVGEWWVAAHGDRGGLIWSRKVCRFTMPDYFERYSGGPLFTPAEEDRLPDAILDTAAQFLRGEDPPARGTHTESVDP